MERITVSSLTKFIFYLIIQETPSERGYSCNATLTIAYFAKKSFKDTETLNASDNKPIL